MASLGDLERSIMDVLWDSESALCAAELRDGLAHAAGSHGKGLALTTVLTVLSRLEHKGFVVRDRSRRPHRYRSLMSREDHMALLMHEVLGSAPDREAVLARFVGRVSAGEADQLRRLLGHG